ncbi:hypothetical protein KIW84_012372 [Lathyrus oleraceus]|uniref:Putative plant transposon protein domain-containing protein n=1 Tax=Pisum sativum TaxID=3888 RepID=A0A9D5BHH5_PEA|nr:hypothetical protein KIW84_012372 [Pisum sativum]
MIGSLLYLTATRPDILFRVCHCARFQSDPRESHLTVVKRTLRYLKGTPNLGLMYEKTSEYRLSGYCDAYYTGDIMEPKSTSGNCQFLGKNLISWASKRQSTIAFSTAEAEYISASLCTTQMLWMKNQLEDLQIFESNVHIFCDNTAAICLSKNLILHSRAKHIEIKHHFIRDYIQKGQAPSSSQQTTVTTSVVSTPVYREPHILDREPHIHISTPFEKLEVLCESLVDFENMKRNGVDLTEELKMQGWETYFRCLYGPVYTNLANEFWHFADSDDHYIVSYVLGVKIVITEKSIASLLNMEKTEGRHIYNINPREKYLSQEINPTIFQQSAEGKHSKNKELHQNLRVWLKIILGTIHHRPASNSSDYINTDQKCILYCIHKGLKLCLPAFLFKYLRDSVKDTRNNMKTMNYIPLGRLISDVLIESGLVDHLIQLRLMEDVTIDTGRPLNARNLKSMGIIDQVRAKPTLDTSWEALRDQREIPNRLFLFSKIDPPEVVAYYIQDLSNQGVDISDFTVDWLPEHPPNFMKRMREPSEKSKKAKKAKLGESSGSRPPVPLVGSPGKSVSLPHSVKIKPIASSLPQTTPIYTSTETPPSTTRSSNPPSLKFNLATTTLPVSEAEMLNETTSPSSSPSP